MTVDGANNISVGPLIAVTLKTGGVWQTYTNTVALTKALIGLANNTLYNVYVYYSAGLQIQVSLDPVDATRAFKDGDEGYVFVGYVMTDVAGTTVPAQFNGTTYTYLRQTTLGGGITGNLVLDQGSATSPTAVPLGCVPSYAQSASFIMKAVLFGANGNFVLVSAAGDQLLSIELLNATKITVVQASSPLTSASVSYFGPGAFDLTSLWVTSFTI
jgi:hypothetical protein